MSQTAETAAGFAAVAIDVPPSAGLADALADAWHQASARWPEIGLSPQRLGEAIAFAVGGEADAAAAIRSLRTGELWLACACLEGHRGALAQLERILESLRPTLLRMGAGAAVADELLQLQRERLLGNNDGRLPALRSFRARGELRKWIKVGLVRDAVRALRRDRSSPDDDAVDRLVDTDADPELAAMRQGYRDRFREAFAAALAELEPRDRTVLRHHVVDELNIDEIGALYRVHRATAARWLVRIRDALYEQTRRTLLRTLQLTPSEFDSVMRLIRSRLDASIAGHLADAGG
ncbi:MAG: sigma-70 family RNA polymerase sigma factor [Nannocystaceae bacterium]|nr:sigma-70 family RNA polymerase sigma factor [Nannocystaceae bacterium]